MAIGELFLTECDVPGRSRLSLGNEHYLGRVATGRETTSCTEVELPSA